MTRHDDAQRLHLLHSLRRYRDLEVYARECVARHPDWGEPYTYLGQALAGLDRPVEGIEPAELAVGKCPYDPWVHASLAFVLLRAGRFKRCRRAAEEALRLDPEYCWAYTLLADAEQSLGHFHWAVDAARDGLAKHPTDEQLLIVLGWSLIQLRRLSAAEDVADRGLSHHPNSPGLHNLAGFVHYNRAQRARREVLTHARLADHHFAVAVRLRPDEPHFRSNLKRNALVARKAALMVVLYAAMLIVISHTIVAIVVTRTNHQFCPMMLPWVLHCGWFLVSVICVKDVEIVLLTAPLDRFNVPGVPLTPAERLLGRAVWAFVVVVEVGLIAHAVGMTIGVACGWSP